MNSADQFQWESAVRRLIVFIAVLCTVAPLVLYLLFSLGKQKISMGAEADIFAHTINDQINNNPDYWKYENIRFSSILRHRLNDVEDQEYRQLFDNNYKVVAENDISLQPPLIEVEVRVFDAGEPVGILKITRSIRSILKTSILVFLISGLCGGLVYFILHVFPLKVLRLAFAALYAEKKQATITLQSITDAVITTDTSSRILSCNPAAAQLAGVQPAKVLGEHFREHFDIVHPQTREKMDNLLEKCFQNVENQNCLQKEAIFIRQSDSSEFKVEITVSPLYDEQARTLGMVIVVHDVTAARALEERLKEKMQELVVIVKYAGVGIAFVRDGIIQEVNTIASEILDLTPEAIIGQRAGSVLSSYLDYSEPIDHIYEKLSKGEIFDIEHQFVRSDRKRIWLRLIAQGVDPNRVSTFGSVWIIQDISRLKQYQEDLQIAKNRAEEASRFKSEFLSHVNHELRNPLSGIIGLNRLVLETDLTSVQRQYLTVIQNTAETLLQLINNLLDLSKIEAGMMELEEKPFRIGSIYEYVNNLVFLKIKEKGLSLTLSISEDVPLELIGDELRLGQVILNLVENAIKFTSTGGIKVSCERISQTETTVQLRFNVNDTGCGIDEEARKNIFDAFKQASTSVARTHGGSGLGLSICKKFADLMGGDIQVESERGKGSTFTFSGFFRYEKQPENRQSAADQQMLEKNGEPQKPARQILLVEDLPYIQAVATLILEEQAHCVKLAANGREALVALTESTFDAIFMDIQMPLMDGLTATRLIRRCERERIPLAREDNELMKAVSFRIHGKHIPIIGMTGNSSEDGRLDCFAAGMDNCITKPFERQEMLTALHEAFQ